MIAILFRSLLGSVLIFNLIGGSFAVPAEKLPPPVVADFQTTLKPGILHGWALRPSSAKGGYVVEVTPLAKPKPGEGNYVQAAWVHPEYDGSRWNDVLRVQLPEGSAALRVNLRVYETSGLPVLAEFETVLEPGVWHGWSMGSAAEKRGYVAEVTPLDPGNNGDCVEKIVFQPEFPGEWIDVLRLQISQGQQPTRVQVRIYQTAALPVIADFDTVLQPGGWQGYFIQRAKVKEGYVVEISPLENLAGGVDSALTQPEYDGKTWNDVLRVMAHESSPALLVNVRLYAITPPLKGQ